MGSLNVMKPNPLSKGQECTYLVGVLKYINPNWLESNTNIFPTCAQLSVEVWYKPVGTRDIDISQLAKL